MDEKETLLGGSPMVEFDDVVEFFSQRAPSPCPACGSSKWNVSSPVPGNGGMVSPGFTGVRLATGLPVNAGLPVVYATCKKCAYLRIHGLFEISQWKAEGKPEYIEND